MDSSLERMLREALTEKVTFEQPQKRFTGVDKEPERVGILTWGP
jgi:hypothetical protein